MSSSAGQHVQPPSDLTPEVLAKVAKLLGAKHGTLLPAETGKWVLQRGQGEQWSDGDLLLAVLNKAAEMGTSRCLYVLFVLDAIEQEAVLAMTEKRQPQYAKAALLAFSQLEPSNG